jgi:hypothetical protein
MKKIAQNVPSPDHFCKKALIFLGYFCNKKQPKENNRQIGENSPNLSNPVTLFGT